MCGSHFVSLGGTVIFQVLFVKWFGQPRVLAIFTLFFSIPLSVMTSQVLFVKGFGQSEFGYYCLSHFISPATLQPGLLATRFQIKGLDFLNGALKGILHYDIGKIDQNSDY